MSKRMAAFKRRLTLISMGGVALAICLPSPCGISGINFGCCGGPTNANLVDFYQGVCAASIEAFRDSTANIIGSDFDAIVLSPTADFLTAMCGNCVDEGFPLDPGVNTVWRE
jgi:hypothetical protein